MASEIQLAHDTSAQTLYAIIRNAVGQVWQTTTSTFVTYVTANIGNYDIALTEQGTSSAYYVGDFPAAAAGVYSVSVYIRAGGSPAEGDTIAGAGSIEWNGTAVIPLSFLPVDLVKIGGVTQSATDLKDFADTGYDPATHKVQGVVLTDAVTTISDKTGYSLANGSIVTATFGTCDFTTTMKSSLNAATPAVTVSDKTGFSLANASFVTATFGTCDFTNTQKTSIQTAAAAAIAAAEPISANITKVNSITIGGSGTTLDPWGPA